jgi:hypothetical protein
VIKPIQVSLVHGVRRYRSFRHGDSSVLRHHKSLMTELPQPGFSNPPEAFNKLRIGSKPVFTFARPLSPNFAILNLNEAL